MRREWSGMFVEGIALGAALLMLMIVFEVLR